MPAINFNKPQYVYKRFRVKKADGKSTTVSVEPALVVHACQAMGSLQSVGQLVREVAFAYDPGNADAKNRSAYVSQKLREAIAHARRAETPEPARAVA